MDIKGFKLSTDYKKLWAWIQDGHIIPAWMPIPDVPGDTPIYQLVEVKVLERIGEYRIGTKGVEYAQEFQTEESFVQVCEYWGIQYIPPTNNI